MTSLCHSHIFIYLQIWQALKSTVTLVGSSGDVVSEAGVQILGEQKLAGNLSRDLSKMLPFYSGI